MLPEAALRAWESDTPNMGGIMELAGVDPELALMPRGIKDHPWIGHKIKFPFVNVGEGKIVRCIIHPRGELMFDVQFPQPVPPVWRVGNRYEVVCEDCPTLYHDVQRFVGSELKALLGKNNV